jgi:hypothetical protein
MLKTSFVGALLASSLPLFAADYSSQPLPQRVAPAADQKLFTAMAAEATGVNVPNVFNDPRMWGDRFRELTLGAVETGVAVADFNRDGLLDIYAISKNGPNALYLQTAAWKFEDVAKASGVDAADPASKTGVTVVDINQDGAPDIYVCRYDAPNLLYINDGKARFTEQAQAYGLAVKDASVHAVFADYDRDGHLDCYLVTNILDFSKSPQGRRDFLFRNQRNGTFADVTTQSGVWGLTQGHTAIWFDANHDGWPDLYVANDFETPDRFYLNKGDGTFADVVDERLPHVTYFSMGADAGDLNNDGLIDFFITDMRDRSHAEFMTGMEEIGRGLWEMERVSELVPQYMWNAVYLNTGTDRFEEAAHLTGMSATGWTWAARLADLDSDGRLDAFFTTGMIRNFIDADLVDKQNVAPSLAARANVWKNAKPRNETTLVYRNLGDLKFANVSADWGLDQNGVKFGSALADLDADGDLDLVLASYDAPPSLIRNDTAEGHRVAITLAGQAPNLSAIGAELRLESESGEQIRQIYTERGIVSSEPATAFFGLGQDKAIKKLTVHWPRGQIQVLHDLPVDHSITIPEPAVATPPNVALKPAILATPPLADALFAESAAARGLKHSNTLKPFDEFSRQRLLPRRLNGMGPTLATADVNADGISDLFVSGSAGQSGELFYGQSDGTFVAATDQPWSAASAADDIGAAFFDADGNGSADLLVAAGGVEHERGNAMLNDRLYLNDGKGRFKPAPDGTIPPDAESTGPIAAVDFDQDGDMDVFVGGRVVPGRYPETPRSFLYRNDDGKFVDVTDELAPALRTVGMVTAATAADIDGDQRADLVLALEWGSVTYFRNTGKGFEDLSSKSGLAALTGWWSALNIADVNGDGRMDIVAGNVGLNTKYRASAEHPTLLFAGDLDGSGKTHLVEAQYENGVLYPVRGRSKLGYAFPWLARKYPTYRAFAKATIPEIFSAEKLAAARTLAAAELASGIFIQESDGHFAFQPLPRLAQLAPINAIVARDLDGDSIMDLYCVGNHFGPEPNTGRFDGSLGVLLRGDGRGNFVPLRPAQSGLAVQGDARAAVSLTSGKETLLAVARCDGPLLLFSPKAMPAR